MNEQTELPLPDPAWDYSSIWSVIGEIRSDLATAVSVLSSESAERGNKTTDLEVLKQVAKIQQATIDIQKALKAGKLKARPITQPESNDTGRIARSLESLIPLVLRSASALEHIQFNLEDVVRAINSNKS